MIEPAFKRYISMQTRALHPRFGVEVQNVDLGEVTRTHLFPQLRRLFEEHSLLLFRNQNMNETLHNDFALLFGPLEDRVADAARTAPRDRPPVPRLSNRNVQSGELASDDSMTVLNLVGNQQWHTDSTFLHTPALANIITAYVVPSSGGETELVSTRAAYEDLPEALKQQVDDSTFFHSLLPSRLRVDPELLKLPEVSRYESQAWRAVWPNPVTGTNGLYLAGHIYGVRDMPQEHADELVSGLIEFATRPEYVYSHQWQPGDVLAWDERATMHRGRPWPYAEERTLYSCCVSVQESDGLSGVRPPGGGVTAEEAFHPGKWTHRAN